MSLDKSGRGVVGRTTRAVAEARVCDLAFLNGLAGSASCRAFDGGVLPRPALWLGFGERSRPACKPDDVSDVLNSVSLLSPVLPRSALRAL